MQEKFYCLDCLMIGDLDAHGRCATCGSNAVAFPEGILEFKTPKDLEVEELERIWSTV